MKTAAWFESLIILCEQCKILGFRYKLSINVDKLLVAVPFEENVSLTRLSFLCVLIIALRCGVFGFEGIN